MGQVASCFPPHQNKSAAQMHLLQAVLRPGLPASFCALCLDASLIDNLQLHSDEQETSATTASWRNHAKQD